MAMSGLLALAGGLVGCGLVVGLAGLVAWALLDNRRKTTPRDE